jgi:hypothetical protein
LSALAGGWVVLLACPLLKAQVNVEPLRRQIKEDGLGARISASMKASGGNTEQLVMGGGLLTGGRTGRHFAYLNLVGDYGRARGQTIAAQAFGHLRYNLELLPWLWGEAFGQLEADQFRRVLRRELVGIGPRVGHDGDQLGLFLGTSYMPERTHLDRRDTADSGQVRLRHRWNNYAALTVVADERVLFVAGVYYQPRFDEFSDYHLLVEPAVVFKVTEVLNARIEGRMRHESRPPEEIKSTDYSIRNSVEATF